MYADLHYSTRGGTQSSPIPRHSAFRNIKCHSTSSLPLTFSIASGMRSAFCIQCLMLRSGIVRVMEIPDGIPKWAGHRGESELLQELTEEEGYVCLPVIPLASRTTCDGLIPTRILPKYKGKQAQGQIHSRETTQPGREDP